MRGFDVINMGRKHTSFFLNRNATNLPNSVLCCKRIAVGNVSNADARHDKDPRPPSNEHRSQSKSPELNFKEFFKRVLHVIAYVLMKYNTIKMSSDSYTIIIHMLRALSPSFKTSRIL